MPFSTGSWLFFSGLIEKAQRKFVVCANCGGSDRISVTFLHWASQWFFPLTSCKAFFSPGTVERLWSAADSLFSSIWDLFWHYFPCHTLGALQSKTMAQNGLIVIQYLFLMFCLSSPCLLSLPWEYLTSFPEELLFSCQQSKWTWQVVWQ